MTSNKQQERLDQEFLPGEPERSKLVDTKPAREIGGPKGPEPTRYGDWERAGRCVDF
jgi:hypothetical protein